MKTEARVMESDQNNISQKEGKFVRLLFNRNSIQVFPPRRGTTSGAASG